MYRSILPNILVSLGFALFLWGKSLPILDWQISNVVSDYPSNYEIHVQPSPWKTRVGDSLGNGVYVSVGKFIVSQNGNECSLKDTSFIVNRSQKDEIVERKILSLNNNFLRLMEGVLIFFFLSVIYIWWYTMRYKRPVWKAVIFAIVFTIIAGIIYIEISQVFRVLLPRVVPITSVEVLDCYVGTISFTATLSRIHYESLFVFLLGILLEVGAFGIMLNQVSKAITKRIKVPI